jgi:hypothetical protein
VVVGGRLCGTECRGWGPLAARDLPCASVHDRPRNQGRCHLRADVAEGEEILDRPPPSGQSVRPVPSGFRSCDQHLFHPQGGAGVHPHMSRLVPGVEGCKEGAPGHGNFGSVSRPGVDH